MHVRFPRAAAFGLLTVWLTSALSIAAAGARPHLSEPPPDAATAPAGQPSPGHLILETLPEPLLPKQPHTESDEDRLEALSLFSAGRMAERRKDYTDALRFYQRALRYDPQALLAAQGILRLTLRLDRQAELFRYALKVVELEDADPVIIQGLAAELVRRGDLQRAIKLYEKALAASGKDEDPAGDVTLRMDLGQLYHLLDEYRKAADNFARVLEAIEHPRKCGLKEDVKKKLLSEPGKTYTMFGESFLLADRPEAAIDMFQQADQVSPNKGLLGYNLARVYARTDKPDKALASLQAYFEGHLCCERTAPYRLLEEILKKLGHQNEFLPRLEKLREEDPGNGPLGFFLAEQYFQAEQFDKAEPIYLALAAKTGKAVGYRGLVDLYRKTNRTKELLNVLGEVAGSRDSLGSLGAEAQAISADADLLDNLIRSTQEQLQADPKSVGYGQRLALALLTLDAKRFDSAGEFFDLAIEAKPQQTADLLLIWGVGLLVVDQFADAAEVFRRGIDQKALPEDRPEFHSYLATALEMEDRTDEALAAARKAVELARRTAGQALQAAKHPPSETDKLQAAALKAKAADLAEDVPRYCSRVAWILYHGRRREQAADAYAKLIEEFDSDHESTAVRLLLREARLMLSNLFVIQRDVSQAEEWLQQVLDEFPENISALNDLGYLWADQDKHLNRAYKMIQQAVEGDPDNEAYRDSLGWVLLRMGRHEEALVQMQKAAAGDQPDPVILDHLGEIYLRLNQPDKAKDAWRRAAEAFRKDSQTKEAERVEKKLKG